MIKNLHILLADLILSKSVPIDQLSSHEYLRISSSPYFLNNTPGISLQDYLKRFSLYMECSDSCYIISLGLLDRAIENNNWLYLTPNTIHK